MSSKKISITGLSGNEIYCLGQIGYRPGELLVGNSVYSMGLLGSVTAGFRGLVGGEIVEYTDIISEGRKLALTRLAKEVKTHGAVGATGVNSELVFHAGNIEFLSIGSSLHAKEGTRHFTTAETGQDLYCQLDAHYKPIEFVFGNVAYSIGMGRGLLGTLRRAGRGEVKEFSSIFNTTRHRALERIVAEARHVGANSITGIKTSIIPFGAVGVQEMVMTGTASSNPHLPVDGQNDVVTSDLSCEEMWGLAHLGLAPVQLLLSTSIYSLGIIGGITSFFKSLVRGEINELTTLIYDAREKALDNIREQAARVNADEVVGVQTHIYQMGSGLIEFLVLGTAVRRAGESIRPNTATLLPQALIRDRDSFFNAASVDEGIDLSEASR